MSFQQNNILEHLQQLSNTLNLDAKLKKKSSSNGAIMGADDAFFQPDWAGACWGR